MEIRLRKLNPLRIARKLARSILPTAVNPLDLPPWVSPNVWAAIVGTIAKVDRPRVFEYGAGCSSVWHSNRLIEGNGGRYVAVEHSLEWHAAVVSHLIGLYARQNLAVNLKLTPSLASGSDCSLRIVNHRGAETEVVLRYRPAQQWERGEGTAAQFKDYVDAPGEDRFDLIVVDGRARIACVDYVLRNENVRADGTLVLCEAGRGLPQWLGQPTTSGPADYQHVVRGLVSAGATLLDGIGYGNWPGLDRETRRRRGVRTVPAEVCVLSFGNSASGRPMVVVPPIVAVGKPI